VLRALYSDSADVDRAIRSFDGLGAPLYVLYRAEDDSSGARPWERLERRPDRFEPALAEAHHRVYRLIPAGRP
jgi:hypothetical protein